MLTVKAINEDGYEDNFCCHVVRSRRNFLMLETHGAETKTGISYEQVIWFDRPHGYKDTIYTIAYVSCGGQTIGKYKRDVKPPLGIAKAA